MTIPYCNLTEADYAALTEAAAIAIMECVGGEQICFNVEVDASLSVNTEVDAALDFKTDVDSSLGIKTEVEPCT